MISKNTFSNALKDPRNIQILWLSSFLLTGIICLDWLANVSYYFFVFISALSVQILFIRVNHLPWSALKSAVITSLGLCLLLKVNQPIFGLLAGAVAIGAKFLVRLNSKHIFNPANLGILVLVLLGEGWISPGQWGNEGLIVVFIAICGLLVTMKVGRLDTGLSFLTVLLIAEFLRTVVYQGWPMDHFLHTFSSGTIFLFAFFMITDPMTSPNSRKARLIWGAFLALTSFWLSSFMQLYTAPIWALFIWSLFTPIFDKIFIQPKFKWI